LERRNKISNQLLEKTESEEFISDSVFLKCLEFGSRISELQNTASFRRSQCFYQITQLQKETLMTTLAPTLYTRTFPRIASWLRDLTLIVLGTLFVAILAQVIIPLPFTPIPLTGQTFAVLLVAAALGSKRGAASMVLYLAAGVIGLPFFAGGAHGLSVVIGATGGYLVGFIGAAYVIGLLAERGLERNIRTSIIPFLVGTVLIYACGVMWLTVVLGSFSKAITLGLVPFLIGDAIKLVAAALALPAAWKLAK
jgi:biotin transport system substrate-specific component